MWAGIFEGLWTSATSTGAGATGVTVPSSSATRRPIVAPILALACLNVSDNFSWNKKKSLTIC